MSGALTAARPSPLRNESSGGGASSGYVEGRRISSSAGGGAGSSGVLSMGKHGGRSYDEVIKDDPEYCQWVVATAGKPDTHEGIQEFAGYIQAQASFTAKQPAANPDMKAFSAQKEPHVQHDFAPVERQPLTSSGGTGFPAVESLAGIMAVGKHKGRAYSDIVADDPEYCKWVIQAASKEETSASIKEFAAYVQREAPHIQAKQSGQNRQAAPRLQQQTSWQSSHQNSPGNWPRSGQTPVKAPAETHSIVSGQRILTAGAHQGKTFEQVFTEDSNYSQWAVDQVIQQEGRPSGGPLEAFAIFVQHRWLHRLQDVLTNGKAGSLNGQCLAVTGEPDGMPRWAIKIIIHHFGGELTPTLVKKTTALVIAGKKTWGGKSVTESPKMVKAKSQGLAVYSLGDLVNKIKAQPDPSK